MGAILPYQSAYAITNLGWTASNISAASTATQLLYIAFKPAIGFLADYLNNLKATIIGLTVIQAIFTFLLFNVPSLDVGHILDDYIRQTDIALNKLNECHLCNKNEDFLHFASKLPFDHTVFEKAITCFQNTHLITRTERIQCSEQNTTSFENSNMEIRYSMCNFSDNSEIKPPKGKHIYITQEMFLYISISYAKETSTDIICEKMQNLDMHDKTLNINFSVMKNYCYFIPRNESINLGVLSSVIYNQTISAACGHIKLNEFDKAKKVESNYQSAAIFGTYQFWVFTLFLIISCMCISSIFTISDTACYESIQNTEANYGQIRAYGAISWGIIAPLAGLLYDYTGTFLSACLLMMLCCTLQVINLRQMDIVKPDFSLNVMKDMKKVFNSFEFISFEIGAFMNGIFTGVTWFYLTWFIIDIGGNKLVIGLAHSVQCFLGELPFMVISNWMIDTLGHFNVVSLSLFAYAVRFFLYSYLSNPWWILPVEILHGLTFGSFYPALTSYAKKISKAGTEATTQTILQMTHEAIGAGLGLIVYGQCFDKFGSHTTFYYSSWICVAATVINTILTLAINLKNRNTAIITCKT